jgi:hypothetical protein
MAPGDLGNRGNGARQSRLAELQSQCNGGLVLVVAPMDQSRDRAFILASIYAGPRALTYAVT